ncbi:hypothetical protein DL95DRAFT_398442, partial [Leptodontidium sp. 2 PMI_412]
MKCTTKKAQPPGKFPDTQILFLFLLLFPRCALLESNCLTNNPNNPLLNLLRRSHRSHPLKPAGLLIRILRRNSRIPEHRTQENNRMPIQNLVKSITRRSLSALTNHKFHPRTIALRLHRHHEFHFPSAL